MSRNYYEVLGISREAGESEIKKAYRKLAMQYHPDRNNGDQEAEARFKEATEAYEVLRDPAKREQYDRFGRVGGQAGGFGGFHPDLAEALSIFMRDFGGMGGFDAFFGGGERGRRVRRRGQDVRMSLPISFAEVFTGTRRSVKLRTLQVCETCRGSGARGGTAVTSCRTCAGAGEVRRATQSFLGQMVSVSACPTCNGEGSMIEHPCDDCRGDGRTRREQVIEIEIPPGVNNGNYLTLRGKGQAGPRNGPPGDLVVVLEVEDDPGFERDGDDLWHELPVSFSQAALGADFVIELPNGPVAVNVPAGSQSDSVITVRGSGVPNVSHGHTGDLHVRLRVWTPVRLSKEMKGLFERLGEVEGEPPAPEARSRGFWDKVKEALT